MWKRGSAKTWKPIKCRIFVIISEVRNTLYWETINEVIFWYYKGLRLTSPFSLFLPNDGLPRYVCIQSLCELLLQTVLNIQSTLVCLDFDVLTIMDILLIGSLTNIFSFLHWHYGTCRTQASFRINFQASISLVIFLQFLTPIFFNLTYMLPNNCSICFILDTILVLIWDILFKKL
jgi:hypothetical protein